MPEKLATMEAPPDYTPETSAPATHDAEIELFAAAREHIRPAEYQIKVLATDLDNHLLSLRQGIRVRTAERQANITLVDLEVVVMALQNLRWLLVASPDLESTGFSAENLANVLDAEHARSHELALKHARAAERQISVFTADLVRYEQSLHDPAQPRTAEQQATLSLADLELIMQELLAVGRSLLKMQQEAVD